jgi:XTP/dITP diphosphohydrolase/ATP diphosphatase
MALRGCNQRFRQRFLEMERASARPLEELTPAELEALWTDAKRRLAKLDTDSRDSTVASTPAREPKP